MKNYALTAMALIVLSVMVKSNAQQSPSSKITKQKSPVVWQDLVVPSRLDGLTIEDRSPPFPGWLAASYKSISDYDTGTLYTGESDSKWPCWVYDIDEDKGGYGYLFDPVMTQDKVFFRYGMVEGPDAGYKLLYVDKNRTTDKIQWISRQQLHDNRVEISYSGRYVAYVTGGGNYDDSSVPLTLCVTDIQKNKVAQVATGIWPTLTYWWDGEKLRFLDFSTTPPSRQAPMLPTSGTQVSVPTHESIESKQFTPATGTIQMLGRQLYRKDRFYLENYYNAFFGESYTKVPPKYYADVPQSLKESMRFDSQRHEILFASRVSFAKLETTPDGQAHYRSTFVIVSMMGSNKFAPLADFSVRSFQNEPTIKLFRVGEHIFAGVTSHSSVPSTFIPQIRLPSRIMTIYELKNGKAEVVRQEENCFGLSQLIDGVSVFASY